jgi:hypothetical protein
VAAANTTDDAPGGGAAHAKDQDKDIVAVAAMRQELEAAESELADQEEMLYDIQASVQRLKVKRDRLRTQLDKREVVAEANRLRKDWGNPACFQWSDSCTAALHTLVPTSAGAGGGVGGGGGGGGGAAFRPNQREAINATLSNRDTFCIMPTGGGKSLCFMVPAIVGKGLTVVISPLLALMQDQIILANRAGINAVQLHSTTPVDEARTIQKNLTSPDCPYTLLYITPEKIVKSKALLGKLEQANKHGVLKRIVIDEAHCCSEWGTVRLACSSSAVFLFCCWTSGA